MAGCHRGSRAAVSAVVRVKVDYREKRRPEYPPIEEQLDAIWKGGAEMDAMRLRVLAVKARFPKPLGEKQQ